MNRTSKYRFWLPISLLGCLGMWGEDGASADEASLPGSVAGSEARDRTPDVAHDRWGTVHGRVVTRGGSHSVSGSRQLTNIELTGLEHAVIYAHKVTRVRESYLPEAVSHLPAAVLEMGPGGMTPHMVPLLIGQPLVLRNKDSHPHVFVIRPPLEQETNVLLGPNQEQRVVFHVPQATPLAVTCSLHEEKPAYVFATTHPYVAVSDGKGEFVLHDLPADEPIDLRVWHERARRRHDEIITSPEWTAGRRTVVVPAGAVLDLKESLLETTSSSMTR